MRFTISQTDEVLVSHSGLALAGALLQGTSIRSRINAIRLDDRKRPEVSHGDVVASMIGLLCLGCRHPLSYDPLGIEIRTCCAIIACMLISLWTGRKPTLRT